MTKVDQPIVAATADQAWVGGIAAEARERVPFYRSHLAGIDAVSLEVLPTFHKGTTAPYGPFPLTAGGARGAYRVVATSGTTGKRMCVGFDRTDWDRGGDWLEKVGKGAGLGPNDVLLNTHCYGLWIGGPVLDHLAQRSGAGVVPLGPTAPTVVLQFLADGIGTAISATPSYMRRLIETAEEENFDLTNSELRVGFIGAESAEAALRQKLLDRLPSDFTWVELYGLTETCGPSLACAPDPDIAELEINVKDFVVEVLDLERDEPVGAGEVGELTLTTRTWCRTPLLRYRTRDLGRATAGTESAATRISRILGRADDALKVGGVLVYPTAVAEVVTGLLPASAEWRALIVRSGDDDRLIIEIEAADRVCRAIETAFDEQIGVGVNAHSKAQGSIARSFEKTTRILTGSFDHASG